MTREQVKSYINPKLLSDDLIVLGDGDTFDIGLSDRKIDQLAELELKKESKQEPA